jgi:hypothetical protein
VRGRSGREALAAAWRGETARPGVRRRWLRRASAALLAAGAVTGRGGWRAGRGGWRWLRGRWRRAEEALDDGGVADEVGDPERTDDTDTGAAEPEAVAGDAPPHPDDVPRRPDPRPESTPTTGGAGMFTPATLVEEALAKAASYDPEDMWQFIGDLGRLPMMADNFAKIFTVLATKCESELPAARQVADLLHDIARVGRAVSTAAQEAESGARRAHEAEIARRETPRPGERKWNV